ncbi:MAG: FIST C-terminal domain-containing protein, partial [Burkholderiales bacterium]
LDNALAEGRYRLIPIVAANPDDRSVTLAFHLEEGKHMFWALRQPLAAERNMRVSLDRTEQRLGSRPDFAVLASSSARGPVFYGGKDRDLLILAQLYPEMPFIGFYGNGEIACIDDSNQLLEYATVFGLFRHGAD